MNRTRLTYLLGLLLGAVVLSSSQDVTIFSSRGPTVTVPSMSLDLMPGLPLLCGLESDTLPPDFNYTTRWRLPGREIINSTRPERFVLSENLVSIGGRSIPGTVLVVLQISYQDAGMYTCEGRSTDPGASPQWAADSFELQLNLELLSNTSAVMATMDDSTIALYCEMRAFIRPDSSLVWEEPGGRTITGETGKHQITFSDGSPDAAAIGGGVLVPSRVSKLTITNPEPSDAGTYTCSVMGTSEAVTLELQVNGSISGSTSTSTQSSNQPNETTSDGVTLQTTISVTGETSTGQDDGVVPLALILGCSLVGASSLILVVMIIFIIAACASRRKSYVVNNANANASTNSSKQQAIHYDPEAGSRPVYAQVYKNRDLPPEPITPVRITTSHAPSPPTEESVISNGTSAGILPSEPQPREILAYSSVPRHGFRPFPPPPHVASWLNQSDLGGSNWETTSFQASVQGPVDFYDGASDVSSVVSSVRPSERHNWQNTWHPSESYYDRPEALHEDVMSSINSSVLPLTMSLNQALLDLPEDHYQVPNSRPATLPRRNENKKAKYDQTFKEQLEPSMFQALTSSFDQSSQALPYAPIYDCPRSLKKSEEPIEISRQNIVEIRDLGVGHFGRVVLAATTKLSLKELRLGENTDKSCSVLVAIKKLRQDADMSLKEAFQSEIKFMSRLKHANVVRLIGVCTNGGSDEPFLMMEYMENGDLHEFLQKQLLVADTIEKLEDNHITPLILLYMTVQIASGMRYLASKKYVHRDLATRNCLVGRDFVVKISDFGMSRNLYESFYYRVQGRLILPIRWMAYESFYGKFSVKSDTWSFGVTIWEIYTLGQSEPYEEMTDEEYINDAVLGVERKILSQPSNCPDDVYEVMMRCFVHEPNMRADFEEIYSRLFLTYTKLGKLNTK